MVHSRTVMPPVSYAWRSIEGLPDPAALAAPEMRAFTKLWQRQRQNLCDFGVLELFQERLARGWSIETGVLEPSAGMWALDVFVANQSNDQDEPRLFYLDVEPLLLSAEEEEEAQLERIDVWLEQMTVQAVAQWAQFL